MDPDLPELTAYDFCLPESAIAQQPLPARDGARMAVLDRSAAGAPLRHAHIRDLPDWLRPGDLIVVNRTRVLAAKLRGRKASGGRVEALVLGPLEDSPDQHRALLRTNGRLREGLELEFDSPTDSAVLPARVSGLGDDGEIRLAFGAGVSPYEYGETPLPPYIKRSSPLAEDRERYQTVFGDTPGAVAAPTAGLHLSTALLTALEARGVEQTAVVLHVGPGTFKPLERAQLQSGRLHAERFELSPETAAAIDRTRERGGRVVAVGTTTTRVLEARARADRSVEPGQGETELFLRPGDRFQVVDALLTNFHLPRSSLLLLVCAFAGREPVLAAYRDAIEHGYRFYSYGDAMLVL